jgi:hypothetical protein
MGGGCCCCGGFFLLFQDVEGWEGRVERDGFGGGDGAGAGGGRELVAAFGERSGLTKAGLDFGEFEEGAGETEGGVVVGAGEDDGWGGRFHHHGRGRLLLLAGGFAEGGGDGGSPGVVEEGGTEGENAAAEGGEGVGRPGEAWGGLVGALVEEGVDAVEALFGGAFFDVGWSLLVEDKGNDEGVATVGLVRPQELLVLLAAPVCGHFDTWSTMARRAHPSRTHQGPPVWTDGDLPPALPWSLVLGQGTTGFQEFLATLLGGDCLDEGDVFDEQAQVVGDRVVDPGGEFNELGQGGVGGRDGRSGDTHVHLDA